jgi:hypothetical protein
MRVLPLVLVASLGLAAGCVPLQVAAVMPPLAGGILGAEIAGHQDRTGGHPGAGKGLIVGALVGLAIDAVVAATFFYSLEQSFPLGDRGCESRSPC